MCCVSLSPSSYKSQIDAQAEREGTACDWFVEELGQPERLTRLQLLQLEHIAYKLRVVAAEAGEWRLDHLPKYYRSQRHRMIARCFGTQPTRREKKWWTAPSDWLTTRAERRAHSDRIASERAARVDRIRREGRAVLTVDEAVDLSGLNRLIIQRAAKSGRLRAVKTTRGVRGKGLQIRQVPAWSIRAVDLADYVSRCNWSNRGKLALPQPAVAIAMG